MATECTAYRDAKGGLHSSPEKATLEDLANVLGRVGEEGGMTAGVAKLILDKRSEIERVFSEHDRLVEPPRLQTAEAECAVIPVTCKKGSLAHGGQ